MFIDLQSQNFDWAKREGRYAYDYGYGITTDNSGNVYTTGKYEQDSADFSGILVPCVDNHDVFIAKYSPTGTINWVTTFGGDLGDYAHAIACDGTNLFVAGEIEGYGIPIYFENSSFTLTSIGYNDAFIAKYDLNGTLQWAKQAGWLHNEKAQGVTYDNLGNSYICGFYDDTTYFENIQMLSQGLEDIFIAKYDPNGVLLWVRNAGGPGRDEAKSIKCDAAGNVYMCGLHSDACMFGTQTLSSPNNYYNAFVAKIAPDGTLLWVTTAGGDVDDVAWSLTMDNAGKIFVSGEYNAYATFGPYFLLDTLPVADIFVACYDAAGNPQWVKGAGGSMIDRARGIGCDGTNIFITGQFGATVSFDSYTVSAADSSDVFMAALDNSGNFLWATSVGGIPDSLETLGYECGNAICAEAGGAVYATGSLLDGGDFGSISYSEYGRTDIFVTRISQPMGIQTVAENKTEIRIYPNPSSGNVTVDLNGIKNKQGEALVYNSYGQCIEKVQTGSSEKFNLQFDNYKNGIYYVEVRTSDMVLRKKVIIQ
ncbi:MAG: T9SS type A sorting domain-containing protein [Bacteroidia bacterium]